MSHAQEEGNRSEAPVSFFRMHICARYNAREAQPFCEGNGGGTLRAHWYIRVLVPCDDAGTYALFFRALVSAASEESESVPRTFIYQCARKVSVPHYPTERVTLSSN